MWIASQELLSSSSARRERPVRCEGAWRAERTIHRHLRGLEAPLPSVRTALVRALLFPLEAHFGGAPCGAVRIGDAARRHRLIKLHGVRLLVPVEVGTVEPRWVTVVHRTPRGAEVASGLRFGGVELEVASVGLGLPREALRQLTRSVAEAHDPDWLIPLLWWAAGAG